MATYMYVSVCLYVGYCSGRCLPSAKHDTAVGGANPLGPDGQYGPHSTHGCVVPLLDGGNNYYAAIVTFPGRYFTDYTNTVLHREQNQGIADDPPAYVLAIVPHRFLYCGRLHIFRGYQACPYSVTASKHRADSQCTGVSTWMVPDARTQLCHHRPSDL